MIIGFGSGVFHNLYEAKYNFLKADNIRQLSLPETHAIEIHINNKKNLNYLLTNHLDLTDFDCKTVHAPILPYENNNYFNNLLRFFRKIKNKYEISNIVIHPDKVKDWSIFNKFKDLPISIENMDKTKSFGKKIAELQKIIDQYNLNLTLDLQHCFTNDTSMELAKLFHNKFSNKIVEYHISGYHKQYNHYPVFKTKQNEIIKSIKLHNIPIIIESTFHQQDEHKKELTYILKNISKA